MFNFLQWPSNKTSSTESQIPFSPTHPMIANLPVISGVSILSNVNENPSLNKLHNWFKKYPDVAQHVFFHVYSQTLDQKFYEFRNFALTSQIDEGISLVLNNEHQISELAPSNFAKPEKLNQQFQNLIEMRKLHTLIMENAIASKHLEDCRIKCIKTELQNLNLKITRLLSLLTAVNAAPLSYIPVVYFQQLSLTQDFIRTHNKHCCIIENKIAQLKQNTSSLHQGMLKLSQKYQTDEENQYHQLAYFHTLIASYRQQYDQDNKCINLSADISAFSDFLNHPNSIAYPLMAEFMETQNSESFHTLVKGLIKKFNIQSKEEEHLIHSLCSMTVSETVTVHIQFCGSGTFDNDQILYGIELFTTNDPLNLLKLISNHNSGDCKAVVEETANIMKMFSPNYRQILLIIHEFSISEYLSERTKELRNEIGKYIEQ